jgi:hypothetical protein
MRRLAFSTMLLVALGAVSSPALAVFVFRMGDSVYVDGKKYSWDEWKKIRDNYPPQPAAAPAAQPVAVANQAPAAPDRPRAASCSTSIYHAEFPADDERFECSAGLGALTREELLRQGWKIDLVEKIPAPADEHSPAGVALFRYKLVISR